MSNESGDPAIDQSGKGGDADFIKRLLAASEPPELDDRELALLEAHLNSPIPGSRPREKSDALESVLKPKSEGIGSV